jgi:iron complex outermembrane recepter protein
VTHACAARRLLVRLPFFAISALASAVAGAQAPPDNPTELDSVVVTGTRVQGLSPSQAISPVDAYTNVQLEQQAGIDMTDVLRTISPSFNVQRFPIADGTAFIRPANLRNLSPDHTLVLINGHRRHRSALVNLQVEPFGTVNQGAQAVDFGLIPALAVDRIEVLRDGAAAQYGSDAIAGVINIILKDNPRGLTLSGQGGQAYEGDGGNYRLAANLGLPLGASGFLNLTGEFLQTDFTSRGSQRPDAALVEAARPGTVPYGGLGQRWGDPDSEGSRLFFNGEIDATESMRVYGHGNYARTEFNSSFFYRTPVGVAGVTPRATLFVDADGDGAADPVDQEIVDELRAQGRDPDDYLTPDASSPSGYVALNPIAAQFPGGYTPSFGAISDDYEAVFGLRGDRFLLDGMRWDLSARYGANRIDYRLDSSINPSLGRLSPTSFRPGVLEQRETGVNADFVYPLAVKWLASPLNVATGLEYRTEEYEIGTGDPKSYESSPTASLFGVGSDGFQGDTPDAAGTFDSTSRAAYIDLEADIVKGFSAAAAARVEDSDAFDTNFDWKLSARANPVDWGAVRATVSTGFRAPTPGQINTQDITTNADSTGTLVPLGTFPVNGPVARALGATPLRPEESRGYTLGFVLTPMSDLTLTVDYYNIKVDDRIALANFTIEPGSEEQQALIDAGVEGANLIGSVSYFTNAYDSTVEGVELSATSRVDLGYYGWLGLDLRHALNKQHVDRVQEGTIDNERVFDLENQLPEHRSVFSANYQSPWNLDLLLRVSRYGGWKDLTFGEQQNYGAKYLVDLVATAHLFDRYHLALGAENLFDTYPEDTRNSVMQAVGATRPVASPFGFNGGLWFLRVSADLF